MRDLAFVCAIRHAFALLAAAPLSAVRVSGAKSEAGTSFPVVASQLEGACGGGARLLAERNRRAQALSPILVELSVDVSRTALTPSPSSAERAVRAEIEAAFMFNPSLVDSLFSAATLAACSAQGIPSNACPNPPSQTLSLAGSSPLKEESGSVSIPIVAGAVGGAIFIVAAAVLLALLLRWRSRPSRSKPPPPPGTSGLVIRQTADAPLRPQPTASVSTRVVADSAVDSKHFKMRTVFAPSVSLTTHVAPDSRDTKHFKIRTVFAPSGIG